MQNPILKFRQSSFVSKKKAFSLENRKLWQAPTLKFCTRFRLTNVCKWVFRIFIVLFRSRVIGKPDFCECVEPGLFWFWQTHNSSFKQNEKNLEHAYVDTGKYEACTKFQ